MIVEELVARLGFDVQGIDKLKRAAQAFKRLDDQIKQFAAALGARLGRIAGLLTTTSLALARFGAGFLARTSLITAAAAAASAGLAKLAAATAKARQETIDAGRVGGVSAKQLYVLGNAFKLVGADAGAAREFLSGFAQKVRDGAKEGGDFADALAKQGVKLKDAKGRAKDYSLVLDQVLLAAGKISDMEKRRQFLKTALEGAPDPFLSKLIAGGDEVVNVWKKLIHEARNVGGQLSGRQILDTEDFSRGVEAIKTSLSSLKEAFDAGVIETLAQPMRQLTEVLTGEGFAKARDSLRSFAAGLTEFLESIRRGGFLILGKVASAIGELSGGLDRLSGVKFTGLWALAAALGAVLFAAAPLTTTITALLAVIGEFMKWKEGTESFLGPVFDAIAKGARVATEAVTSLNESLKELFSMEKRANPTGRPAQTIGLRPGETNPFIRAQGQPQENTSMAQEIARIFQRALEVISPRANVDKIGKDKQAAVEHDNRKYENIGNDQRTISAPVTVNAQGLEAVAAAVRNSILGAISTKGANTSTGALTAP